MKLPAWFKKSDWHVKIHQVTSDFLPASIGLTHLPLTFPNLLVNVSAPERAFLELLYVTPHLQSPEETRLIAEHLSRLRPDVLQLLLEKCASIRVKRLCLYIGKQYNHPWLPELDLSTISLGTGERNILKEGGF